MHLLLAKWTLGTVARLLLVTLLTLWLTTGSNLFGYRYWNVTQDKYEAALAKWHSLPIEVYEETVDLYRSGKWKIVVQVKRTSGSWIERVTSLERLDDVAKGLEHWDSKYFEDYFTVEAMLRNINFTLEHPNILNPRIEGYGSNFTEIRLDTAIGYPRSYTVYEPDPIELISVSVKVLK